MYTSFSTNFRNPNPSEQVLCRSSYSHRTVGSGLFNVQDTVFRHRIESSHRFLRITQSLRFSLRYYSSESYYASESYYSEEEEEEEIVTAS